MGFLSMLFGGRRKKGVNYIAKIKTMKLPVEVEKISGITFKDELVEELKTFKVLDYSKVTPPQLEEKSYHSYQIGILLKSIKEGFYVTIDDLDPAFHEVVKKMPASVIKKKIYQLAVKYAATVDMGNAKSQLQSELIWSPIHATLLIYFIHKSYKPPKS